MFAFRRTRLAIYGTVALMLWISAGHGPAMLGNLMETANAKLMSALPGGDDTSAPQAPLGAWKNCSPIAVYVNPGDTGGAVVEHSQAAIASVAQATGMPLEYAGTTTVVPTSAYVYGEQPAGTIVIAWTTPDRTDLLTESRVGGAQMRTNDRGRISAAALAINTEQLGRYQVGFGAGRTTGNVLLHELAHTLGAPHAPEGTLMYRSVTSTSPDGFTDADLQALQATTPDC